jgi:hypothetical protein
LTTKRVLATNDHGGPIKLSPGDMIHPNHTGANPGVLKTITIKLSEWPQLNEEALAKYERQVIANPNLAGVNEDVLEHPSHAMSYPFPLNESKYIAGFDISKGGRAFTIYPRSANAATNALERYTQKTALRGCTGAMRENHVQHIWIHPKGLPRNIHLSPHKHFVFPSGVKIDRIQIGLIVAEAVRLGVIYPPGCEPTMNRGQIVPNPRATPSVTLAYEQKLMNSIIIQ